VLDRQLQNTVAQFEQTKGVVKKIDGTSRQLKEAIQGGARIITTTIQKFGTDHLKEVSGQAGRKFAILIDEAHGSQSGKRDQALTDTLTREATSSEDVEDLIAEYQKGRGPQPNISAFAFTATPRNVTLERFGMLEAKLKTFGILDVDEIERFAAIFYKGPLDPSDRIRLEGLVRQAVQRFELEDDEGRQEEFRQLLKSYMRYYSFVAQVVSLGDTGLEKLHSYAAWLIRLLPNREVPADIEITEDMMRVHAFKIEQKEAGSASLAAGVPCRCRRSRSSPQNHTRLRRKNRFLKLLRLSTTATAHSSRRKTSFASSR
jgi:SWI2/SNF2 ATPase